MGWFAWSWEVRGSALTHPGASKHLQPSPLQGRAGLYGKKTLEITGSNCPCSSREEPASKTTAKELPFVPGTSSVQA